MKRLNPGSKKRLYDANRPVPKEWTQRLVDYVSQLPDCPEVTYLRETYLSKYVSDETLPAELRRKAALRKWMAAERDNEATNVRLLTTRGDYNILPGVTWHEFLDKVRGYTRDIIGDIPSIEDTLIGAFSGGASTSRSRAESHPASKYLGQADITPAARYWFEQALELMPGWNSFSDQLILNEVRGNEFFTVPKNTDIDRCACKEPDINMFLQKGVGNFFRQALRRVGINLNDQSRNQSLAREGSITGRLATIDLSAASDSITTQLVYEVLPLHWHSLLSDLRSSVTIIDGEEHSNEMFSSMGNGFTFELESLLFYVIARAVAYFEGISGVISVYGDDIIVPVESVNSLIWVFGYLGFSVNPEKSYWSGPFRESCGGHYHSGYDITPFYLRKPIKTLTDLIHIANAIRRWSSKNLWAIANPLFEDLWFQMRDAIPSDLWGGHDYNSITQLASCDPPTKKLVARTARRKSDCAKGYIHWLNATWQRIDPPDVSITYGEPVITSERVQNGSTYRLRSAKPDVFGSKLRGQPYYREIVRDAEKRLG